LNGNRNGNQSATSLKRKPPSADEQPVKHVNGKPVFQRMVNGKKMEWCKQCKRWTTTHNTGTHRKKSEVSSNQQQQNSQATQANTAHIVSDPSIWLCEITEQPTSADEVRATTPIADVLLMLFAMIGVSFLPTLFADGLPSYIIDSFKFVASVVGSGFEFGVDYLASCTLLDVYNFIAHCSAPVLWIILIAASIYGKQMLYYLDPSLLQQQQFHRKVRRHHQSNCRRATKKYHKQLNKYNAAVDNAHLKLVQHATCAQALPIIDTCGGAGDGRFIRNNSFVRHKRRNRRRGRRIYR